MSTTLTIRKLAEPVKQRLRIQAARHGRSMEAEAREILTAAVSPEANANHAFKQHALPQSICAEVRGIWTGRGTTDSVMEALRGDD